MNEAVLIPDESPEVAPGDGIVLVGNPNVGKSALFGALTGRYVTVSNYPGTTVELTRGYVEIGGARVAVVDTPGTNSLSPSSDDERVTRDVLLNAPPRTVLVVGDAKNVERTLLLALQLAEMELPLVVALNMWDEASGRGLDIDALSLGRELGVEAVPTVAIHRLGLDALRQALAGPQRGRAHISYPAPVERAIAKMLPVLPSGPIARRALALLALGGDEGFRAALGKDIGMRASAILEAARLEAQAACTIRSRRSSIKRACARRGRSRTAFGPVDLEPSRR